MVLGLGIVREGTSGMIARLLRELDQLAQSGQLREFATCEVRDGCSLQIRGRRALDFTSWDYFGLASDPRVVRAAQGEIAANGMGTSSSRLNSGTLPAHTRLERRLAEFFGYDGAVLFSSKTQAILSLITSLATERDAILHDELLRTPVPDAAYLVNAPTLSFSTSTPGSLESELEKTKHNFKKLVFLDALSPITGEVAPLLDLSLTCKRHDALLVVDESYGCGTLGLRGAGGSEGLPPDLKPFCLILSLTHAVGGYGAAIVGPAALVDYLVNRSRTFSAEVSPPSSIASAAQAALDIIEINPSMRDRLALLSSDLRKLLLQAGISPSEKSSSPIVSIPFERIGLAQEAARALFSRGFLVEAVPRGTLYSHTGYLRAIVTLHHSPENIAALARALGEVIPRVG